MKIRRITMAVLVVLTVLFVADIRYGTSGRNTGNSPFRINIQPGGNLGPKVEKSQSFERSQGELTSLVVNGQFGTISLRSVVGDTISVQAAVVGSSEEELEGWEIEENVVDSEITYSLIRPKNETGKNVGSNYVIEIPEGMDVRIEQQFGEVKVEQFTGYLHIGAQFSNVFVKDLQGTGYISSQFGTADLRNIAGPLTLVESYSTTNVELAPIDGGYTFEVDVTYGTFKGELPLEIRKEKNRITGRGQVDQGLHPVNIKSNYGTVKLDIR